VVDGVDSSLQSRSLSFHDNNESNNESSMSSVSMSEFKSLHVEDEDTDDDDASAKGKKAAPTQLQVIPRRRKSKPKSQAESLADLSQGVLNIYKSMEERAARMMEEEKARDKAFLEFHDRQSELNRQHESV
jgi:hypothetical protein